MSSISTYVTSVTTHYIHVGDDEFETLFEPDMMVDPHVEISGDRAMVRYAVRDEDYPNPREDYDHCATLVQCDSSLVDVDQPDLDIAKAWDYFIHNGSLRSREEYVARWVRIYRPDVVHFAPYVIIGHGYGYAYITEGDMLRAGFDPRHPDPAAILRSELDEYAAWAGGEVYGVAEENYERNPDGSWVRNGGEDVWGFIGTEYAQQIVSEGY